MKLNWVFLALIFWSRFEVLFMIILAQWAFPWVKFICQNIFQSFNVSWRSVTIAITLAVFVQYGTTRVADPVADSVYLHNNGLGDQCQHYDHEVFIRVQGTEICLYVVMPVWSICVWKNPSIWTRSNSELHFTLFPKDFSGNYCAITFNILLIYKRVAFTKEFPWYRGCVAETERLKLITASCQDMFGFNPSWLETVLWPPFVNEVIFKDEYMRYKT